MPCLDYRLFLLDDQAPNVIQFAWAEPMIPSKRHRRQPELGLLPVAPDVDVHRFGAIETVEEEPVRPRNSRDSWQFRSPPKQMISGLGGCAKSG
jgi:hypothetical protein